MTRRKYLTKEQVMQLFRADVLPGIKRQYEKDGVPDKPARAEAWNNFTDMLREEGYISAKAYDTWTCPF